MIKSPKQHPVASPLLTNEKKVMYPETLTPNVALKSSSLKVIGEFEFF